MAQVPSSIAQWHSKRDGRDEPGLALIAIWMLVTRAPAAIAAVWVFNVWGTADLLHAFYQGQIGIGIGPGTLGAAFYIPTVVVPPLLIIHGMIFWLLLRRQAQVVEQFLAIPPPGSDVRFTPESGHLLPFANVLAPHSRLAATPSSSGPTYFARLLVEREIAR
jgi:hypothetical protein